MERAPLRVRFAEFLAVVSRPFRLCFSLTFSRAIPAGAATVGLVVALQAGLPAATRNPGIPPVGKPGQFTLGFVAAKCVELQASAPLGHYRFFRFRTDLDYDEAVPSTIVVSGGKRGGTQTYLSRSFHTSAAPHRSWRYWLLFVYIPLWCVLGLLILLSISVWIAAWKSGSRTSAVPFLVRVLGMPALLVLISGYLAGSNFVVDNATGTDLRIQVDGNEAVNLPAGSFLNTRVSGDSTEVKVFAGEQMVESAKLDLDDDLRDIFIRAFRGRGSFVYNIAASNSYVRASAGYSAR